MAALWGIQLVDVLVVTSVTPAIPTMLASLQAPKGATTLLAAAAAMSLAGLLLLGSRLGDRYGHRRVLVIGMVVFGLASIVGATAGTIYQLVVARTIQGAAAALCVPTAMWALLHVSGEPKRRRTALAGWSAGGAIAGILGYVVGGVLTQSLGWQWIFWINVPLTALLLICLLAVVPSDPADATATLDVPGAALLTVTVMTLVGGASVIQDKHVLLGVVAVVVGCALGGVFVRQQRRTEHPLIPRPSWRNPRLRLGVAVSLVNTATTSGIGILTILLLQNELSLTPTEASLVMMPFSAAVVIGSIASRLPALTGSSLRPIILGLTGIAAGGLILAVSPHGVPATIIGLSVAGIGLGLASVGATSIGTSSAEEGDTTQNSTAVGLLNTSAQVGNALGIAILLGVAGIPNAGFNAGFALVAVVGAVAAVVSHRLGYRLARRAGARS